MRSWQTKPDSSTQCDIKQNYGYSNSPLSVSETFLIKSGFKPLKIIVIIIFF